MSKWTLSLGAGDYVSFHLGTGRYLFGTDPRELWPQLDEAIPTPGKENPLEVYKSVIDCVDITDALIGHPGKTTRLVLNVSATELFDNREFLKNLLVFFDKYGIPHYQRPYLKLVMLDVENIPAKQDLFTQLHNIFWQYRFGGFELASGTPLEVYSDLEKWCDARMYCGYDPCWSYGLVDLHRILSMGQLHNVGFDDYDEHYCQVRLLMGLIKRHGKSAVASVSFNKPW